jgi:hypothetical protein
MRTGEVLGPEAARIEQRHRQCVAQGELRRGAGGGRQVQRARFLFHAAVQHDVGMPGERGARLAGHRHQRHAQALEHRQDHRDLVALATVGDRQHQVDRLDHAQVAVAGLGRVHEHGRGAGGRQGGGDLAAHVAALAHAHHDHAAAHGQHGLDRAREAVPDAGLQAQQGGRFDVQRLPRQVQRARGLEPGL